MGRPWNSYSRATYNVGSGVQIWAEPPKRYISGGMVVNKLDKDEKLAGGSPVEFNIVDKTAKILRVFKVKATNVVDTNTIISVERAWDLPILKPGMVVMVMPNTITGTGKAVVVSAVDNSTEGVSKFTVPTADIDAVSAGKYLVESESATAGSGKKIYCLPTSLTLEDTVGGGQNSVGIALGPCTAFINVIPYLPDPIKNNLQGIYWQWYNEKVEGGNYVE